MAKLFVGTSGYVYSHWENDVFYPKNLPKTKQLEYYSTHFATVEMNYPFYRLPSIESFKKWKEKTPKDFVFALKVSRVITHIRRFHQSKKEWKTFLERALYLEEKLGPFLFQFPPSFKKDPKRLQEFIKMVKKTNSKHRFVLEFRHPSWFSKEIFRILKKEKNISLCLADSPKWPQVLEITGDFVYIRMHGGKILYSSDYSKKELKIWVARIKKWLKNNLDVYVYFNNDAYGYAIKNAKTLLGLISSS